MSKSSMVHSLKKLRQGFVEANRPADMIKAIDEAIERVKSEEAPEEGAAATAERERIAAFEKRLSLLKELFPITCLSAGLVEKLREETIDRQAEYWDEHMDRDDKRYIAEHGFIGFKNLSEDKLIAEYIAWLEGTDQEEDELIDLIEKEMFDHQVESKLKE